MTSLVNPNNIDGTFPVAGQDNNSQGFRDNFTNIKNNFTFLKSEVEDLQAKAVLKEALLNSTLDNDLGTLGTTLNNAQLTAYRETYTDNGTIIGAQTVSYDNGNFQKISLGGSVTLTFNNWPDSGVAGRLTLWINCPSVAYTLTLPAEVTLGFPTEISGLESGNVITFDAIGDYLYEFVSTNGGSSYFCRELTRAPNTIHGNLTITGNVLGNLSVAGGTINSNFLYLTRTTGQTLTANTMVTHYYLDSASSSTLAAQTISVPSTAENGRMIAFTSLCPITTTTWSGGTVKYVASNAFASGNVTVRMQYYSSGNFWLTDAS